MSLARPRGALGFTPAPPLPVIGEAARASSRRLDKDWPLRPRWAMSVSEQTTPLIYWIERLSPIKCRDLHFRGTFGWHAASLISSLLGIAASRLFSVPKAAAGEGIGLLMIAPPARATE